MAWASFKRVTYVLRKYGCLFWWDNVDKGQNVGPLGPFYSGKEAKEWITSHGGLIKN